MLCIIRYLGYAQSQQSMVHDYLEYHKAWLMNCMNNQHIDMAIMQCELLNICYQTGIIDKLYIPDGYPGATGKVYYNIKFTPNQRDKKYASQTLALLKSSLKASFIKALTKDNYHIIKLYVINFNGSKYIDFSPDLSSGWNEILIPITEVDNIVAHLQIAHNDLKQKYSNYYEQKQKIEYGKIEFPYSDKIINNSILGRRDSKISYRLEYNDYFDFVRLSLYDDDMPIIPQMSDNDVNELIKCLNACRNIDNK